MREPDIYGIEREEGEDSRLRKGIEQCFFFKWKMGESNVTRRKEGRGGEVTFVRGWWGEGGPVPSGCRCNRA